MKEYYSVNLSSQKIEALKQESKKLLGKQSMNYIVNNLLAKEIANFCESEPRKKAKQQSTGFLLEEGMKEQIRLISKSKGISQRELIEGLISGFLENPSLDDFPIPQKPKKGDSVDSQDVWEDL